MEIRPVGQGGERGGDVGKVEAAVACDDLLATQSAPRRRSWSSPDIAVAN